MRSHLLFDLRLLDPAEANKVAIHYNLKSESVDVYVILDARRQAPSRSGSHARIAANQAMNASVEASITFLSSLTPAPRYCKHSAVDGA
ncbi:MAG: hypothetical protein R3C53_21630 [Pirellulaceae bacterium]